MADPLAGQVDDEASATPPADPSGLDIEALKAQLKAEADAEFAKRAAGFQKALNEKDAALKAAERKAIELQMSGMTEDEKDALEWQQMQERLAAAERKNALYELRTDYGELVDLYQQMTEAPDVKAQLEFLKSRMAAVAQPAASPQAPAAEPELEIPPVDKNNPPNLPPIPAGDAPMSPYGVPWTKELAARILAAAPKMR